MTEMGTGRSLYDVADGAIDQIEIAQLAVIELRRKKWEADQACDDLLNELVDSMLGQPNPADATKPHSVRRLRRRSGWSVAGEAKQDAQNLLSMAEAKCAPGGEWSGVRRERSEVGTAGEWVPSTQGRAGRGEDMPEERRCYPAAPRLP
jgi:hypothetical protein